MVHKTNFSNELHEDNMNRTLAKSALECAQDVVSENVQVHKSRVEASTRTQRLNKKRFL